MKSNQQIVEITAKKSTEPSTKSGGILGPVGRRVISFNARYGLRSLGEYGTHISWWVWVRLSALPISMVFIHSLYRNIALSQYQTIWRCEWGTYVPGAPWTSWAPWPLVGQTTMAKCRKRKTS